MHTVIRQIAVTQGRGSSLQKSRRLLKLVEAVVRVAVRAGAMLAQVVTPLLSVLLDFAAVGSRACSPRTHPGKPAIGLARKWGSCLLQLRDEQEIRASAYAGLGELYHVLVCVSHMQICTITACPITCPRVYCLQAPSCAAPHMTRFLRQTKTVLCGSVLEGPRVRRAVAMALAKMVTGLHTGRR